MKTIIVVIGMLTALSSFAKEGCSVIGPKSLINGKIEEGVYDLVVISAYDGRATHVAFKTKRQFTSIGYLPTYIKVRLKKQKYDAVINGFNQKIQLVVEDKNCEE